MPKLNSRDEVSYYVKSKSIVLTPSGEEFELDMEDSESVLSILNRMDDNSLRSYILSEELKANHKKSSISMDKVRQLELAGYEPASDAGHLRFYPNGSLVLDLLIDLAYNISVVRLGAMKIETPLIYDWRQDDIREQAESFHERHYVVKAPGKSEKEWIFRFAGDFGLFRMLKDSKISYRNLPFRVYELSKSFRYERKGELNGLKRLRAFTMPDIHSFTSDLEQGLREYSALYSEYDQLARKMNLEYAVVFRIVESFYLKHKKDIVNLLKHSNKPAFIELLSEMKHYWVIKNEFQGIDSTGSTCQLSTVQLDTVDSIRYSISYSDPAGKKHGCVICHSSIGSIERWIHIMMENAVRKNVPSLPFWLSPVQVRIIPIEEIYLQESRKICNELTSRDFRCDLDDRNIALNKKVMEAGKSWVPYIVVLGKKEIDSGLLSITERESGRILKMGIDNFIDTLVSSSSDYPRRRLTLPVELSKRPIFRLQT